EGGAVRQQPQGGRNAVPRIPQGVRSPGQGLRNSPPAALRSRCAPRAQSRKRRIDIFVAFPLWLRIGWDGGPTLSLSRANSHGMDELEIVGAWGAATAHPRRLSCVPAVAVAGAG